MDEDIEGAPQPAAVPAVPPSTASVLDTKLLGKPEKFSGQEEQWRDWSFVTRSYIGLMNPRLVQMLKISEQLENPIDEATLDPDQAEGSRQFFFVLVMLVKGKATTELQAAPHGQGLEAWGLLYRRFNPTTKSQWLGLLQQLLAYDFGKDSTTFRNRYVMWENEVHNYETLSGAHRAGCVYI